MFKKLSIFLASLLICSSAYAGVNWQKYVYFQNWGGLNDNTSSSEIADNEATDIQNIVFDTGGAIKKRYGYRTLPLATGTVYRASTGPITGLVFFKKNDGTKYLFGTANVSGQAHAFFKQ